MIKLTILALFVALQQASAEKEAYGGSRMLLQANTPPGAAEPVCHPCNGNSPCWSMSACWDLINYTPANPAPAPANPVPAPVTPVPAPVTPVPAPVNPVVNPVPPVVNPVPAPVNNPPVVPVQPIVQWPPPALSPALITPPLREAVCSGVTPTGMPAMPGTATSCQQRTVCPPGVPTTGPTGCAGPMVYTNLAQNFKLYCEVPNACAGSDINLNFGAGNGVRSINQLLFSEPGAGAGTTVNVRNNQGIGNVITVEQLECSVAGTCNGMTINLWDASMNDVNCPYPSNCMGCTINLWMNAPNPGVGCFDPWALPTPQACLIETHPCFGF